MLAQASLALTADPVFPWLQRLNGQQVRFTDARWLIELLNRQAKLLKAASVGGHFHFVVVRKKGVHQWSGDYDIPTGAGIAERNRGPSASAMLPPLPSRTD